MTCCSIGGGYHRPSVALRCLQTPLILALCLAWMHCPLCLPAYADIASMNHFVIPPELQIKQYRKESKAFCAAEREMERVLKKIVHALPDDQTRKKMRDAQDAWLLAYRRLDADAFRATAPTEADAYAEATRARANVLRTYLEQWQHGGSPVTVRGLLRHERRLQWGGKYLIPALALGLRFPLLSSTSEIWRICRQGHECFTLCQADDAAAASLTALLDTAGNGAVASATGRLETPDTFALHGLTVTPSTSVAPTAYPVGTVWKKPYAEPRTLLLKIDVQGREPRLVVSVPGPCRYTIMPYGAGRQVKYLACDGHHNAYGPRSFFVYPLLPTWYLRDGESVSIPVKARAQLFRYKRKLRNRKSSPFTRSPDQNIIDDAYDYTFRDEKGDVIEREVVLEFFKRGETIDVRLLDKDGMDITDGEGICYKANMEGN